MVENESHAILAEHLVVSGGKYVRIDADGSSATPVVGLRITGVSQADGHVEHVVLLPLEMAEEAALQIERAAPVTALVLNRRGQSERAARALQRRQLLLLRLVVIALTAGIFVAAVSDEHWHGTGAVLLYVVEVALATLGLLKVVDLVTSGVHRRRARRAREAMLAELDRNDPYPHSY